MIYASDSEHNYQEKLRSFFPESEIGQCCRVQIVNVQDAWRYTEQAYFEE